MVPDVSAILCSSVSYLFSTVVEKIVAIITLFETNWTMGPFDIQPEDIKPHWGVYIRKPSLGGVKPNGKSLRFGRACLCAVLAIVI